MFEAYEFVCMHDFGLLISTPSRVNPSHDKTRIYVLHPRPMNFDKSILKQLNKLNLYICMHGFGLLVRTP